MRRLNSIFAVALCSVLAFSLLTGCKSGTGPEKPVAARICYDNLSSNYIAQEDMQYALANVKSRVEYDETGAEVAEGTIVDYADGIAKSKDKTGTAVFTLGDGSSFRLEVVPAYTVDPQNQYQGRDSTDAAQSGKHLGGTHDPSLIEVEENGRPAYYIFSTGWNTGNEIRRSTDLLTWEYLGKATKADVSIKAIEAWMEEENKPEGNYAGQPSLQWWAPDIVVNPNGGYWLYTCCVSNIKHTQDDGILYSKACIVLFSSTSLKPESFRYKGVLMQSCIPDGSEGLIDINSIDPQIIYSPDGKMYMAYGSFGTGNWMLELDPSTGLRKDGVYKDGKFLPYTQVREYHDEVLAIPYSDYVDGYAVTHPYYGTMISMGAMEAPVIARHDNVVLSDENGVLKDEKGAEIPAKTYYYSMHSYNELSTAYQMWGGRSESVWGRYVNTTGMATCPYNIAQGSPENTGNKYMGSFTWADKASSYFETDIVLPGHNDLFTTKDGVSVAAYITRTPSYSTDGSLAFMAQIHQYYLNSLGDIVINPNRYGGEIDRSVTKEELLHFTQDGKFKMVALCNGTHVKADAVRSVDVVLSENGDILYGGAKIGEWLMYGRGYVKFTFTSDALRTVPELGAAGETLYYGVVRPTWLRDQNKSGFTITLMGHSGEKNSMGMFLNNYTTIA